MPKLKEMTAKEYLAYRFGENAERLQDQFDNCGKSSEFIAGWLTCAMNQDSNRFWLSLGISLGTSNYDEIQAKVRQIAREFVSQLK